MRLWNKKKSEDRQPLLSHTTSSSTPKVKPRQAKTKRAPKSIQNSNNKRSWFSKFNRNKAPSEGQKHLLATPRNDTPGFQTNISDELSSHKSSKRTEPKQEAFPTLSNVAKEPLEISYPDPNLDLDNMSIASDDVSIVSDNESVKTVEYPAGFFANDQTKTRNQNHIPIDPIISPQEDSNISDDDGSISSTGAVVGLHSDDNTKGENPLNDFFLGLETVPAYPSSKENNNVPSDDLTIIAGTNPKKKEIVTTQNKTPHNNQKRRNRTKEQIAKKWEENAKKARLEEYNELYPSSSSEEKISRTTQAREQRKQRLRQASQYGCNPFPSWEDFTNIFICFSPSDEAYSQERGRVLLSPKTSHNPNSFSALIAATSSAFLGKAPTPL